MSIRYWLMKTEPDVFSFSMLKNLPGRTTAWEGVRNYQARNFMRDEMQVGDRVLIYHSSCAEPGVAGLGTVVRTAYPDATALDHKSPYFDERSARDGVSRWCMVDVRADAEAHPLLSLARMRTESALQGMLLLQRGSRLSVQPVDPSHWRAVQALLALKPLA